MAAVEVDEEQAQPAEPLRGGRVRGHVVGAGEQQAHLRLERLRRPDLPAAHHEPAVAVVDRAGRDPARVGAGVGFGHAERHVQVTGRGARQERIAQPVAAEPHDGVQTEHRDVDRRRRVHPAAGCGDAVQHQGSLRDATPATAPPLGDRDPDPPALGHRGVELPRETVLLVARRPVRVVEPLAHPVHGLDDRLVVRIGSEVHARDLARARRQRVSRRRRRPRPRRQGDRPRPSRLRSDRR